MAEQALDLDDLIFFAERYGYSLDDAQSGESFAKVIEIKSLDRERAIQTIDTQEK